MTKERGNRLTLDRPATYQIKIPGVIDLSQADWALGMAIAVEGEDQEYPITTLIGELDQAALHGLLRRLYSLGLPLISVNFCEYGVNKESY
jgi:hypothetical protein